jgi:hypothetical protein
LSHGQVEITLARVDREHNLEIQRAENGGDILRIVSGIEKNKARIFVLRIADNKRDLSFSPRRVGRKHDTENAA